MGLTRQQQYQLVGVLTDVGEPHQTFPPIIVPAGKGAPTLTDGWAQIQMINRARHVAFTLATGYNPIAMDIPMRFDATITGLTAAQVERDNQVLLWLAGRGKLYANGSHPGQGTPPIVQITSFDSHGRATNLIPADFHSDAPNDLRWLISRLQYDPNPMRNAQGDRIRQDVVVSVVEYVAAPGAPASPRQRQKARATASEFKTFLTTTAASTVQTVCLDHGITSAKNMQAVLAHNQQVGLRVRSILQLLPVGTRIQVPATLLQQ
jgi:hypothetical protein